MIRSASTLPSRRAFHQTENMLQVSDPESIRHYYPTWFTAARDKFEVGFEDFLRRFLSSSPLAPITTRATHPGRRIRPTLFFAFCKARHGSYPEGVACLPSYSGELFHTASIIVDDILDGEEQRRNKHPLFRQYDTGTAILVSHYLVAKAFECLQEHPRSRALVALASECYAAACVGEALDIGSVPSGELAKQQRLSMEKTRAFFRFIGGALDVSSNEAPGPSVNAFDGMGEAFQISNDIVDLLYPESGQRHASGGTYKLHLSYLLPGLIERGQVRRDEVFADISYARLIEIARVARAGIQDIGGFIRTACAPARQRVEGSGLQTRELALASEFLDQLEDPAFWLHWH